MRFGSPPALSAEQIAYARQLVEQERKPVVEVARLFEVHRATPYRALETCGESGMNFRFDPAEQRLRCNTVSLRDFFNRIFIVLDELHGV